MVMRKKYLSIALTGMAIYLISTLRMLIFNAVSEYNATNVVSISLSTDIIMLLLNIIVDISVISAAVCLLNKKVGLRFYDLLVMGGIIYLLFAFYEVPGWYMFVYTGKSGGILSKFRNAYPSYIAAYKILLQYAGVMLITLWILKTKHKSDEPQNSVQTNR